MKKKSAQRKTLKSKKSVAKKIAVKKSSIVQQKAVKSFDKPKICCAGDCFRSVCNCCKGKTRIIAMWSLIIVAIFAVLAILVTYKGSQADKKMNQAATLNLLGDEEGATLLATGDIMLARYVELRMRKAKDYTLPFQNVADFLKSADITFGNLETPFLPGKNVPKNSMTFRADAKGVQGLVAAGYDVVSIANNHTMNYQIPGLTNTLVELKKAGILASGGGKNSEVAHAPVIIEAKGKKIAFLSYIDPFIPPRIHGVTTSGKPGIAHMDLDNIKKDVGAAKLQADIVVVSMHAGKEYKREPTQFQKDFAHAAIDGGASVVVGHHPHWVQPVENYGNGVIFYSLGNFVFDQAFSEDVQTGLIAKIVFDENNNMPVVDLLPVRIENTQPRILEGEERTATMQRLGLLE